MIQLIYILGTSFNGSTLLGYIIGSSNQIENLGELKFYNRIQQKGGAICTCGKSSLDCHFWSKVYSENKFKIYETPSFFVKFKTIFKLFSKSNPKFQSLNLLKNDENLLSWVQKFLIQKNNNPKYLLDTSKSLWRLIHLVQSKKIKVTVIYLKRSIYGNVSSFIKHGTSFFRSTFTYLINNKLIDLYLKYSGIKYLNVNYDKLSKYPKNTIGEINCFLKINIGDYISQVRETEYHVPSGNQGTQKQFISGFNGLVHDDSWKYRLSKIQIVILHLVKKYLL